MKPLLENAKYLILVIVLSSLVGTVVALIWGIYETVNVVVNLLTHYKDASSAVASFVQLMDIFLVAAVLYIFTVTLYELFIGELNMPEWLNVHSFDELKTILSNMVILILSVSFLKYFLERKDPLDTLLYALAVAVVSFALISYRQHGPNGKH